jgi:hypothetical protein
MTRMLIVVLALVAGCMQSHPDQIVEITQESCATCHTTEYDATSVPPHTTAGFPTTCGDCHRTTDWHPALGGLHPEPKFAVTSGPHGGVKCLVCHDLDSPAPSTAGADTNCIQCHPDSRDQRDSHVGTLGPQGQPYAYSEAVPNFCLTCHPTGRANKHPDKKFPRTGPHNRPCTTCHDRSAGPDAAGANTTCLNSGCHSLGEEDRQHREENGYTSRRGDGSNRHFCLECHPTGGGGD